MSDKSQNGDNTCFVLSDHHVITLQGRDAIGFAQAQFMNDLTTLAAAQWQWNGWLTPKGRVIALFALLKVDDETLWLLLPDADPVVLAERLRGFLFRSKVTITVRDDVLVSGRFSPPESARGNMAEISADGSVEFDLGAKSGARSVRTATAASTNGAGTTVAGTDATARWRLADLEHGLPRLDESQVEQWTPQQLSLERLRAFSVKKGCYPGQEIVARTHFLGKAKRGLALLESEAPMAAGTDVHGGDVVIGSVVADADIAGRRTALAVLSLNRDEAQPLTIAGQPVREALFKIGLER